MITRLFFLFFFTAAFQHLLFAEEGVNVIEIRYEVFVENTDSIGSYKYKLPYETYHVVSPDKILTLNKYAADIDEVHMFDLNEDIDYRLYFLQEAENLAAQSPIQRIPTLVTNSNDEKLYQIGGMLCKRYEIVYKNSTIEIYTTDTFGVNFTPFTQVSGYAMQYSFIDEVYGRVTYVARSISPSIVDPAIYSLNGYKITDEVFPEDIRGSFDEVIVAQESSALFKLNKKQISYSFKLTDKTKIDEQTNKDSLVVFAMCGHHKYSGLEKELLSSLIQSVNNKRVKFYFFALRSSYSKSELAELQDLGFEVAFFKDVFLSKFKIEYYPTYILLDKNRKVIKYKIGTNSSMLSSFTNKILELNKF